MITILKVRNLFEIIRNYEENCNHQISSSILSWVENKNNEDLVEFNEKQLYKIFISIFTQKVVSSPVRNRNFEFEELQFLRKFI